MDQAEPRLFELLKEIHYKNWQVSNFEMETAGMYGLAKIMGHTSLSFNAILANRATGQFSNDPLQAIDKLIAEVLERVTAD